MTWTGPIVRAICGNRGPGWAGRGSLLDRERAAGGPRGPLHSIRIVIKDNFETADMPTTGGLVALAGFTTGRDAFQVRCGGRGDFGVSP